jgi:hypothetical protein
LDLSFDGPHAGRFKIAELAAELPRDGAVGLDGGPMSAYRIPANTELEAPVPSKRRVLPWAFLATVAVHVGVLGGAYAVRAQEPVRPSTGVVTLLRGHVADTGFEAAGMQQARVRLP